MFSEIFIERPRLALVLAIAMVIAGVISVYKLPVAEYPEIAPPAMTVTANYDGASADTVLQSVAIPLENEINGIDDLLYFHSSSDDSGEYFATVTFRSGTNTDLAMVNLQNAVKCAEANLPEEVVKNGITILKSTSDRLLLLAFKTDGSTVSLLELNDYVNTSIRDTLNRIPGVGRVNILCNQEYSMRIWLNPIRMTALGISVNDVSEAICHQNAVAAPGSIGDQMASKYISFKMNLQGRLSSPQDFSNIVLRREDDGSVVCIRDIGTVEIGAENYAGYASHNGEAGIGIELYRSPDANALETVKLIRKELKKMQAEFPQGVTVVDGYDSSEFITASLREMIITLVVALLLVVLITWLFLQDWRATLIPAIAIPVALMATFPFLFFIHFSINTLTMFGLILVIGSLCDDAIVVVENTQTLMEREGLDAKAAAKKCMRQITGAIIATTLVTVACYLPLAFYGGVVGAIYLQFAVAMCIALCLSTLVAMTLSPAMCAKLLRKPDGKTPAFFKPFNWILDKGRKGYLGCVHFLVRRALLTLILFVGVLAATWFLFGKMETSFLPPEDKGVILVDIQLPSGASLERTQAVLAQFRERLEDVPAIRSVMLVPEDSFTLSGGENIALAMIVLDNWADRDTEELGIDNLVAMINEKVQDIEDASFLCFGMPVIPALDETDGLTFYLCSTKDVPPEELATVAEKYAGELDDADETYYAENSFHVDTPQIKIDIDRRKAEAMGVDVNDVFSTLQGKFASVYVNDFTMNGRNYHVKVQADRKFRRDLNALRSIFVPGKDGAFVPLSAIAKIKLGITPSSLERFNKMLCAPMTTEADDGYSNQSVMKRMASLELPDGYRVEWSGLGYQERENQGQLLILMLMASLFAYLFLVGQYESWSIPVPVMLSVIFAMLGGLIGQVVHMQYMSIYVQLGLVMLIGLAAKNAILMVEFSKVERESGKSVEEAAMNGANLRFRAVLMTAWSFLFGVFPMVIATGAGAGSRRAIGITTFWGMLLATLVGIIFVPALYSVMQRFREWLKAKLFQ